MYGFILHRFDGEQSAASGGVADQIHQDEVPGAQHVGAGVEVLGGDDVRCRVAAPEVPERPAIGIADSLWWLFGAGYLGYTGARSFDKWRGVTR